MLLLRKKHILQEIATSLFLMLEFDPDTTALSLIKRIRERARAAIESAEIYTGKIGAKDVEKFLQSQHLRFTISCGKDIVKGDVIRFTEAVYNNRRKPSRMIGRRGVAAEITNVDTTGKKTILHMRVIASGGIWDLKPETEIFRTIKNVTRFEVMRVAWSDEGKRQAFKNRQQK